MTGYRIAQWIEEQAYRGWVKPPKVTLHTANPVGRAKMAVCIQNAHRYWEQREGRQ